NEQGTSSIHSHPRSNKRLITENDVCPVCQDHFIDSTQPTCHCQVCGNNVHIPCIKLVAEHQIKALAQSHITCPFCRSEFQSIQVIDQAYQAFTIQRRQGAKRNKEKVFPGVYCFKCNKYVRDPCYQCTQCQPIRHLCQLCFEAGHHGEHSFKYRESPQAPWILATRYVPKTISPNLIHTLEVRFLFMFFDYITT
ncbi:E3 ubiquitin-protein ligase Zswim2, partial [Coelomomyces lativittatus]